MLFLDSDIEFVPCNESTYKKSVFDIQNDMEHFLCRKPRAECDPPAPDILGSNVQQINGEQSHCLYTTTLLHLSSLRSIVFHIAASLKQCA